MLVSIHYNVAQCQVLHLVALFLDAATTTWTASVTEFQTGEGEAAFGYSLDTYAQHINVKNTAMHSGHCQLQLYFSIC